MLQHFKTFIFSKRQLSTYLHAQPLKPHTSDKSMSIMYQVPFKEKLKLFTLPPAKTLMPDQLQILPLYSRGHK